MWTVSLCQGVIQNVYIRSFMNPLPAEKIAILDFIEERMFYVSPPSQGKRL